MKSKFQINKLITNNPSINAVIASSTIKEYDIQAASATAMYFLKGENIYNQLMKVSKYTRNVQVGLFIKKEPSLQKKIDFLYLKWLNMFLDKNNIRPTNFLWSNKDSIMISNKIPKITTFENGIVKFINKNGNYTSMFIIKNRKVLFDSMKQKIKIIGVSDDLVESSVFVNNFLRI